MKMSGRSKLPILPILVGAAAVAFIGSKKKQKIDKGADQKRSDSSDSAYSKDYGTGEVGGRYRLAVVGSDQRCGNCRYAKDLAHSYSGTKASSSPDMYCSYWKTAVGKDYVCDAFSG